MVGIVIVSHSAKAAEGIRELAMQMASPETPILAAGGMEDGGIGTDAFRIQTAIEEADRGEGVLLLVDLGSAIMSAETATDFLDEDIDVRIADTPVLEGAVSAAVAALQGGLSSLAVQQAVSVPQIINSIQSGNSALASQLAQCCCENRLLTTQQGYESQIATLNQTNQLGSQADRNTRSITDAINAQTVAMNDQFCAAKERDLQSKIDTQADIITQLRNQISNDKQTEAFTAAFNTLNQKITELSARQPNTVPVVWPNLQAVNATPYVSGGYYQGGFNGLYGAGANGFGF